MTGSGSEARSTVPPKDPVFRLLGGCVVVVAIIGAILLGVSLLIGWRLARDEAPGRAPEAFFLGNESRYWRIELKPNDAGLLALFARIDEINEATRRDLVRGTFLEVFPWPRRRARLDELAPFTGEFALAMSDPADGLQAPEGWAARGTFSHGLFRLRAAAKLIRFFATRDSGKAELLDVDGIAVTHIHGASAEFAFANVGNRVLVTSDATRMRRALQSAAEPPPKIRELLALHESVAIDGEDAWAFIASMRLGDFAKPFVTRGAAASFDVNDRDELAFRMIVTDAERVSEGRAFSGDRDDSLTIVSAFLPGFPREAIALDGDGARRNEDGAWEISGRITGLSTRLAALLSGAKAFRLRHREGSTPWSEPPSAIPPPPIPPPPSDPRSGTPAEPPHAETPRPPR